MRACVVQTATKLWRRVGRNMDLLTRERAEKIRKMRKVGRGGDIEDEDPDLVEVRSADQPAGRVSLFLSFTLCRLDLKC